MKAIVSVIGTDTKGIIAKVSTALYEMNINIENISQTIMQKYFTMIMAVDFSDSALNFHEIQTNLTNLGVKIGVEIHIQLQSIFDSMHQVSTSSNKI
jgi:ACT domain-containing protein